MPERSTVWITTSATDAPDAITARRPSIVSTNVVSLRRAAVGRPDSAPRTLSRAAA
jgi:hypothetical protein